MLSARSLRLLGVIAIGIGVFVAQKGYFNGPAPTFSLPETDGGRFELASYSGRPVLLVFWTSSCPICQHELPLLNRLEPELRGKGIAVVTINLDGENEARDYISTNSIALKSLYDSSGATARAYHVGGVPKLVLIGKDGKIKRSRSGWTDEDVLRAWADSAS